MLSSLYRAHCKSEKRCSIFVHYFKVCRPIFYIHLLQDSAINFQQNPYQISYHTLNLSLERVSLLPRWLITSMSSDGVGATLSADRDIRPATDDETGLNAQNGSASDT